MFAAHGGEAATGATSTPASGGEAAHDTPRTDAAAPPSGQDREAAAPTLGERRRRVEADAIRAVLDACGGDRERACAVLGISKTTLWRKLAAVEGGQRRGRG